MSKKKIAIITLIVLVVGSAIGALYFYKASQYVYIDTAQISAPLIELAPSTPGTLQALSVHEGDVVNANQTVARVGDELIKTKVAGIVVSVQNNLGASFAPGQAVVTMIDPTQLRVEGQVDENKGLNDIKVGQNVDFTVDAFGGQTFHGVVDDVSDTARDTTLSFSISDKRPVQQFTIKARFDVNAYPELKNGMSARMWIYK